MNTTKIQELKSRLMDSIELWAESRIDALAEANPHLRVVSAYIKRGMHNYFSMERERIGNMLERLSLFVCDADGNINTETLFTDAMGLLRSMPETQFDFSPLHITVGMGNIRIALPDNPFTSLLFGKTQSLRITEDDFLELKNMLM